VWLRFHVYDSRLRRPVQQHCAGLRACGAVPWSAKASETRTPAPCCRGGAAAGHWRVRTGTHCLACAAGTLLRVYFAVRAPVEAPAGKTSDTADRVAVWPSYLRAGSNAGAITRRRLPSGPVHVAPRGPLQRQLSAHAAPCDGATLLLETNSLAAMTRGSRAEGPRPPIAQRARVWNRKSRHSSRSATFPLMDAA